MLLGWNHLSRQDTDRIAAGIVKNDVFGGPWCLEIQPTNKCNVECFFCSSKFHRKDEELPWDALKVMLAEEARQRDLRFLRLSGGGESLIYSAIRPMLDLCAEAGLRIADITTNGTPLQALAQRIVDAGCDNVHISLNEPDADLYASTMQTHERKFDQVLRGIQALREARDAAAKNGGPALPVIQLKFLVWKSNFRKIRMMAELGEALGVDIVMINSIVGLPKEARLSDRDREELREMAGALIADNAAGKPNVRLAFDLNNEGDLQRYIEGEMARHTGGAESPMPDVVAGDKRVEYCYMGWYQATISAVGGVFPCCNFVGLEKKRCGNVLESPLPEIWRGADFAQFRREVRQLVFVEGELEHSKKFHRFLEPYCIARRECPFAYYLCSPGFYTETDGAMRGAALSPERVMAQSRNAMMRQAHRFLRTVRRGKAAATTTP